MVDDVTILCTGDIHLGRHPTRIPSEIDGQPFSPRTIWQRTVQAAIDEPVDAVVITGDIVDRENRYFEAYGAFENAAKTLDEAGIPLIVVGGNHDFDVLPRMIHDLNLDHLHLLGEDGSWERWTLHRDGTPLAHFEGWSFPSEHILSSPLADYDLDPTSDDAPVLGILHADLDTPESDYAPVPTSELIDAPVDAWLLGHIHKPTIHRENDPFIFYPGSPQPLSPKETGQHGPWMLNATAAGDIQPQQRPLASIRYDTLDVDAQGAKDAKAIPPRVSKTLEEHIKANIDTGPLELYLPRIHLTGRAQGHAQIQRARDELTHQLALKIGTLPVHVESLEIHTKPAVDLHDLAQGNTPVASLAQLLLDLESGGPEAYEQEPLVQEAMEAMRTAHGASTYNLLRREGWTDPPDREQAAGMVKRQARLLLDTLLDQKEEHA